MQQPSLVHNSSRETYKPFRLPGRVPRNRRNDGAAPLLNRAQLEQALLDRLGIAYRGGGKSERQPLFDVRSYRRLFASARRNRQKSGLKRRHIERHRIGTGREDIRGEEIADFLQQLRIGCAFRKSIVRERIGFNSVNRRSAAPIETIDLPIVRRYSAAKARSNLSQRAACVCRRFAKQRYQ